MDMCYWCVLSIILIRAATVQPCTMQSVVKGVDIPWNPETQDITIRTDSVVGSKEVVQVFFYDTYGTTAGAVEIYFFTPIKYKIGWCSNSISPFPVADAVPTDAQKTWKITYDYTYNTVAYFCNGVEVLNVVLSDNTCTSSSWKSPGRNIWGRKPTQIKFYSSQTESDTASDSYCIPYKGNPVDGGWTEWAESSVCTVTCGGGMKINARACAAPVPQYGGKLCDGYAIKTEDCKESDCPVDGGWTEWTESSDCTVTCGGGTHNYKRACTAPAPDHQGKPCDGYATKTENCGELDCPVDGGWTEWAESSGCTVTCGGGIQIYVRACTAPVPQHGGKTCDGYTTKTEDCGELDCPDTGLNHSNVQWLLLGGVILVLLYMLVIICLILAKMFGTRGHVITDDDLNIENVVALGGITSNVRTNDNLDMESDIPPSNMTRRGKVKLIEVSQYTAKLTEDETADKV